MNIKATYQYQLADHKTAISIFYFVILCVFVSMFIPIMMMNSENISGQISLDMASVIFLFVVGLCSFKETFGMMAQNGVSRKSMFIGRILTMVTIATIMGVIEIVLQLIFKGITTNNDKVTVVSMYEQIFVRADHSRAVVYLEGFLFNICIFLCVSALGYLITILFYRLNKTGKIVIGVGVPAVFYIILPIVDLSIANGKITNAIINFGDFVLGISTGKPFHAMASSVIGFVLFSGLSWLLMRKAIVKEK